jgi:Abnormal spindle-like microcephaly-assoc'd, ASPM-SPD-2-Hydin
VKSLFVLACGSQFGKVDENFAALQHLAASEIEQLPQLYRYQPTVKVCVTHPLLNRTTRVTRRDCTAGLRRFICMKNFDLCRNVFVAFCVFASWGCPALNASVATAKLSANPSTINFGDVLVANSRSQPGTITNSSETPVTISQGWVSGNQFQVTGLSVPLTLTSGQSATFDVTFTPTATGTVVGTIFITALVASSEDPNVNSNSAMSIPLSGTGIASAGALQASPSSLSFAGVQVGNNITQSETLTNSGDSGVSILQASLTGSAFSLSGLNLPLTLLPRQSFTFGVVFTPTSASDLTDTISIISTASNSILTISLWGTGSGAGQLSLAAPSMDFGNVAVGTSANLIGTLSAASSSVTISSAISNSSEYTLRGLSLPLTLAAGQSTTFSFTFTPQASGSNSARISFISNASNSPTMASLTGSGVLSAPHRVDLSWSPSPSAVVGYNIYRSGTSGGPYAKINSGRNPNTVYTDNTVQAGLTYYYVTTAVDASGGESVYSNQVQAVVPTP